VCDESGDVPVAARVRLDSTMIDALAQTLPPAMPKLRAGSQLQGGRLHVLETLGQGGMGIVYRAFDREHRAQVALKTMHRAEPAAIYALKNEFRSLADVRHPNLVRLFELFSEADGWFFTMELVDGERFDQWVRPGDRLDEARLRSAFAQLIDALDSVHTAGKLHRDIKPSNVLVRADGHVCVLDFGLVTEPCAYGIGQTVSDHMLVGTPAYVAPEQGLGERASVATDLYALGVMLFEALTGRLPFAGSATEMLMAKQQGVPAWPEHFEPSPQLALVELCSRLLSRDPAARPSGAELRGEFAEQRARVSFSSIPPPLAAELIGRDADLAQLRDAYQATLRGKAVLVSVSGDSGVGKTALCQSFLDELMREGHAVVLRGRCNERESLPYKAFDALVDDLSRHLRRLRAEQAAALLPRDAAELTRLFPVLGRVDALAEAPVRPVADATEQQRRAFEAFLELLGRMRDRAPLVLHIDDLQWTDRDSSQLLSYLLRRSEQLPALLIFSQRAEPGAHNEFMDALLEQSLSHGALERREVKLQPLPPSAAESLAQRLLAPGEACTVAGQIGREACGNPFLIGELARFAGSSLLAGTSAAVSREAPRPARDVLLRHALEARASALPAPAHKLLSLLALIGRPLPLTLALEVSGISRADVDALQSAHLVRSRIDGDRRLEFYHDLIRTTLARELAPEHCRTLYLELARACEKHPELDPELRCSCFEGAGEIEAAARCAADAADQAVAALAFDHAARLYDKALALGTYTAPEALRLTRRWARALANAGRSLESARAYQRAALLASGDENLDLQRRSAEQLLTAGYAAEGLRVLANVCAEVGLSLPAKPTLGNIGLAWALTKLRVHAARPPRTAAKPISPRQTLRLEIVQTAVAGLQCYSQAGAARLALDYLVEAQSAGDPRHLVWALGSLGMLTKSRSFYSELLGQMESVAARDGRPELRGLACGLRGFVASRRLAHREAREWFAQALAAYRDCEDMQWQVDLVHVYDQASAAAAGEYAELARTTPALIDEAFQRGRPWAGATLSGFAGMPAWLTLDDRSGYLRQLALARSQWQQHAEFLSHDRTSYGLLRAEAMSSIYGGEPLRGFALFDAHRAAPMKPNHRLDYMFFLTACSAAALRPRSGRQPGHGQAARLRAIVRRAAALQHSPSTRPLVRVFEAVLCLDRGQTELAISALRGSLLQLEAAGCEMHVAALRRRLGQWLGGDEGRGLIETGDLFMNSQGVRDRDAMSELLCPGCAISSE
jgi:hypothetical protein